MITWETLDILNYRVTLSEGTDYKKKECTKILLSTKYICVSEDLSNGLLWYTPLSKIHTPVAETLVLSTQKEELTSADMQTNYFILQNPEIFMTRNISKTLYQWFNHDSRYCKYKKWQQKRPIMLILLYNHHFELRINTYFKLKSRKGQELFKYVRFKLLSQVQSSAESNLYFTGKNVFPDCFP